MFLTCRYTVIKDCTFENINATSNGVITKIEEDHVKVLNCTYTNCSGTEVMEDWCAYENDSEYGDGNEYAGHPFCCKEGWNNLTGEDYQKHVAYAESIGWNHNAEE